MFSIWPLLPVSIAEMPSIMMLFWPAPPRRVPPADAPTPTTPGSEGGQAGEIPAGDRQVVDLGARDRKRSLAALRLHERRLPDDRHGLGDRARFERQRWDADAIAAADGDAGALARS